MSPELATVTRIFVFWAFTRFATMGYFTPEDASSFAKITMDILVNGSPVVYAAWAAWREHRKKQAAARAARPEAMIAAVAQLPEVAAVKVKDDRLADSLGPKVVS